MKVKKSESLALAKLCCQALEEKKAGDLRVLDVSRQSSITDYLVLATANSEPHLRALRIELEKALDRVKAHIVGIETAPESGWIVVDAFDVMVHLFSADRRGHYGLENLWKDAKEVALRKPPTAPKPGKKLKTPRKK
jgi:ribosome-associated protein